MKFMEFFHEADASLSATRLALLLWIFGVLGVWMFTSLKAGHLEDIPESVSTIIGVLMTGKVVQKFGEKPAVQGTSQAIQPTTPPA